MSSNQIVLLENNLQNLMNWVNSNKVSGGNCNANKSASSGEHLTLKLHSPVSQSSIEYSSTNEEVKNKQRLIQIQSANEPPQFTTNHRVYESSNEMALSSLLQVSYYFTRITKSVIKNIYLFFFGYLVAQGDLARVEFEIRRVEKFNREQI